MVQDVVINSLSIKKQIRTNYLIVYLFIALTSIPFFVGDEFLIFNFVVSLALFLYRKREFDKFIFLYSLIFLSIFLAQSFFFSVLEINVILGYFFRILYAYFTIKVIGKDIAKYFINIIYFFAILSFVFYFPSLFFPDIMNSFLENVASYIEPFQLHDPGRSHIIIYTFGEQYSETDGAFSSALERNSGPFWEPGGFGVFLILAIIFEMIETKDLFSKKNKVFFLAVLTTLSTGSFLVLFVLVIFYLFIYRDPKKLLLLGVFLIISIVIYLNTFFLNAKVERQFAYTRASSVSLYYAPRTRFVSAQLDLIDFYNNPVLGRGRFAATRFDNKELEQDLLLNHRNNGTTNLLVEFGFFGFLTFFVSMYRSFKAYCFAKNFKTGFALVLVLIVVLLGFSQMIFLKPFFIGLSFFFLAAGYEFKLQNKIK
ncbi:MAG: O-antigen ligase family protein [Bacteroidia bacterium]|nr:O-antigen ligase family protein [Bacteroidia bacterium]